MHKYFSLGLGLMLFVSCSKEAVSMNSLQGNWDAKKTLEFPIEVKDAGIAKNIIFVVRNNNDYPYSNIRFFSTLEKVGTKNPKVDTLNYSMAKPNGEWKGSGFGDTKEILFQYKTNFTFPENGKYIIKVKQAMRNDKLAGIEDFGVKIEQVQP